LKTRQIVSLPGVFTCLVPALSETMSYRFLVCLTTPFRLLRLFGITNGTTNTTAKWGGKVLRDINPYTCKRGEIHKNTRRSAPRQFGKVGFHKNR